MKPNVYDVTPVLDTSAYADGDLLFDSTEIAGFFLDEGGTRALQSLRIVDEDDQGAALDILFLSANEDLGTANSAYAISDAESRSILATVRIASTDWVDWGGFRTVEIGGIGAMLKAAADSTSVYIAGITRGAPTYTASGLKIAIGVNDGAGGGTGPRGTASAPQVVQGPVADNAAASGNPVPVGGLSETTLASHSTGDRAELRVTNGGVLIAAASGRMVAGADALSNSNVVYPLSANGGDAINVTRTGLAVTPSVFNGTTWDRMRGDTTGTYVVGTGGRSASATITRPNDTAAYATHDVIGAATGSSAAIEFTNIGPAGGVIRILYGALMISADAVIASEDVYMLRFYSVTPPSALGDNAAWDIPAGDRASYLGYISSDGATDFGSTVLANFRFPVEANDGLHDLYVKLAAGSTSLFAYLTTSGAYTPTAQRVYKVTLYTQAV